MERLIAIIGPTATGKSSLGIKLAKYLNTEIISGDSMLVYRKMNIGTAKPTGEERQGIPHHLVDIVEPEDSYNVADFQNRAQKIIQYLNGIGKIPLIVGGTGLYIKSVLEKYSFNEIGENNIFREKMQDISNEYGNEYLHNMLRTVNPLKAEKLHPNDRRRVIRELEIAAEQKNKPSLASNGQVCCYDALVIGLTMERAALYNRINRRVDDMLAAGLIEEVEEMLREGLTERHRSMQGIGYKETLQYLRGEIKRDELADLIKKNTRNFAKRQLTWYRKMPYIHWLELGEFSNSDEMAHHIYNLVAIKYGLQ